jgi:hypothetical protein
MGTVIPRFEFLGLFGHPAVCGLERIDLPDGRVVVSSRSWTTTPE